MPMYTLMGGWMPGNSPVFQDLRHRETRLKGKCGRCRYNGICGGCRGRALALTGDYLAADPTCFIGTDREPAPGGI